MVCVVGCVAGLVEGGAEDVGGTDVSGTEDVGGVEVSGTEEEGGLDVTGVDDVNGAEECVGVELTLNSGSESAISWQPTNKETASIRETRMQMIFFILVPSYLHTLTNQPQKIGHMSANILLFSVLFGGLADPA